MVVVGMCVGVVVPPPPRRRAVQSGCVACSNTPHPRARASQQDVLCMATQLTHTAVALGQTSRVPQAVAGLVVLKMLLAAAVFW